MPLPNSTVRSLAKDWKRSTLRTESVTYEAQKQAKKADSVALRIVRSPKMSLSAGNGSSRLLLALAKTSSPRR